MTRTIVFMIPAAIVVLDSLSKVMVKAIIATGGDLVVTPFFNITLVYNKGIAFGLLAQSAPSQEVMALLGFVIGGLFLFAALYEESPPLRLALGAIAGGGFANALDRILNNGVVDFIDLHLAGYHFPAFNIADAAITLGVIGYLMVAART